MSDANFEVWKNMPHKRGFFITFDNGWRVSIQFGPGNYCANRDADFSAEAPYESSDAEVAVFTPHGDWGTKEFFPDAEDDVVGYVSPDKLVEVMMQVKAK